MCSEQKCSKILQQKTVGSRKYIGSPKTKKKNYAVFNIFVLFNPVFHFLSVSTPVFFSLVIYSLSTYTHTIISINICALNATPITIFMSLILCVCITIFLFLFANKVSALHFHFMHPIINMHYRE